MNVATTFSLHSSRVFFFPELMAVGGKKKSNLNEEQKDRRSTVNN